MALFVPDAFIVQNWGMSKAPEVPIAIRGLDHVVFRVHDLDKAIAFYCDVLGCTEEKRNEELGLYQLRAGNALIDLVPVDGKLGAMGGAAPGSDGHNVDHVCLRIDAFETERLLAWLESRGVRIGEKGIRYGADGYGPSVYIEDPDGNVVELKGPPGDSFP